MVHSERDGHIVNMMKTMNFTLVDKDEIPEEGEVSENASTESGLFEFAQRASTAKENYFQFTRNGETFVGHAEAIKSLCRLHTTPEYEGDDELARFVLAQSEHITCYTGDDVAFEAYEWTHANNHAQPFSSELLPDYNYLILTSVFTGARWKKVAYLAACTF